MRQCVGSCLAMGVTLFRRQ